VFRGFGVAADILAASRGQIEGFSSNTTNGATFVSFQAASGVTDAAATTLACSVIRPKLAGSDWATVHWELVDGAGRVIASDRTACP
jgi:hypothetical protein